MENKTDTNIYGGYGINLVFKGEKYEKQMIGRKVRFQGFKIYEGWDFKYGGEGKIIAETDTAYKIKTGWFSTSWAGKDKCEEIIN